VNYLRRHPLAITVTILVIAGAFAPLPAVVDAVTGAPAGDADLTRPALYVIFAPISNLLDAVTFLSMTRAIWFLVTWVVVLSGLGLLLPGTRGRRLLRAVLGGLLPFVVAAAAVLLPRPVPALTTAELPQSGLTIIDYHSHTDRSHDGRKGWTLERLGSWHAEQGFQAAYVTDHNTPFMGSNDDGPIPLLPGVEWSVYQQHVVVLGTVTQLDLAPYSHDTPGMVGLFAAMHSQGALAIASLPEYREHHWADLEQFVAGGVDGFEIVNCAPKALAFSGAERQAVIALAQRHDLLVTGASDNHGWGKATCVWNVSHEGAHGFSGSHVIARPVALAQGDGLAVTAAVSQLWLMFRGLSSPERISWLTWIALIWIYRAIPRRKGQQGGLGILARDLGPRQVNAAR
jgi:predicted metal-dependent phosphoesterase TrpH